MVTSLIYHERIMTTTPKAKELRKVAEKCITYAKKYHVDKNNQHRTLAGAIVREKAAMTKLFDILGPRYKHREGGYTRVMKLQLPRRGDSADMAYIEFVDRKGELRPANPPPAEIAAAMAAAAGELKPAADSKNAV
jgi:large subunit ribosomal protein L17